MAPEGPQRVDVDGLTVALLDTTTPGRAGGQVPAEQVEWLEDLANEADHPVLVLGHHHPWRPDSAARPAASLGISPDDSARLVAAAARQPRILRSAPRHTPPTRVRPFDRPGPRTQERPARTERVSTYYYRGLP